MKVLFIGTHGQDNIGDELLLNVFIHNLRNSIDEWYINSYEPSKTAEGINLSNARVFHTSRDKIRLLWYIFRCDAVIFGGGSIIKELYTEYGGDKYGTLKIINILTFASKTIFRKPIYMSHIGAGPIETTEGKLLSKKILSRVDKVSVRDKRSLRVLNELNTSTEIEQVSDAVYSVNKDFFDVTQKEHNEAYVVGINLCRNIANNSNWEYFVDMLMIDLIKASKKHDLSIVGISMQNSTEDNNDYNALVSLKDKMIAHGYTGSFEVYGAESIHRTSELISQCDLLVGERLHFLIIGSLFSIPIIPLEYDAKVKALSEELDLKDLSIDINTRFKKNSIYNSINNSLNNLDNASSKLSINVSKQHANALKAFHDLSISMKG
jgi:polysaccharide pyruvyl transferase WcaK-like protein